MTTAGSALDVLVNASAPPRARSPALASFVEFLLVGGATLFLLPLGWLARRAFGLGDAEYAVGFTTFYAAYVINDPHFTVTYFLFYKNARERAFGRAFSNGQRARYWLAGAVVPAVLVAWAAFALSTHSAQGLGWMVQLMFFLVGWHYVKQGFGVLTVLSARKGVAISARERFAFLAHCFAGWAYAWASPAAAAGDYEEKGVVYRALARPGWLESVTGVTLAMSTVWLVAVLALKWRREKRMVPLAPLTGLLVSVWLWSIYSSADPLLRYMIPALHSIQYFYFVWLLKRNEARAEEGPPSFGRPVAVRLGMLAVSALMLGWFLFRGAPTLLDTALVPRPVRGAPFDPFGATPFFAAFYVVVNLHHYFMDYAIWRRENPDTRHLRST